MEEKLLENKNILVTGTARGIGRQMTKTFAENGANVFACARKETKEHRKYCTDIEERYGVRVTPFYFDLQNPEEIKETVQAIRRERLPVDGLVNNAGITDNALFLMTDMGELRRQFEVNFFGPFLLTQYVCKLMTRNGKGSIVSISSSAALDSNAGKSAYGSSKAALLCMTRCIAEELGSFGIRANVICPGVTDTDMLGSLPDYILHIQEEAAFLKKIGRPSDIANAAAYLLSDYSSYITGQVIRVDGGITEYDKRQEGRKE